MRKDQHLEEIKRIHARVRATGSISVDIHKQTDYIRQLERDFELASPAG